MPATHQLIHLSHVAVDCGDLINPDNGAVSLTGTTFMNTATYTCNAGHTLINGDEIRECQSNRTWSGMQPTCQGIRLSNNSIHANPNITSSFCVFGFCMCSLFGLHDSC